MGRKKIDLMERVRSHCEEYGECLIWRGAVSDWKKSGMPNMHWEGKTGSVRRIVYTHCIGPIQDGYVISPKCGDRLCVSPTCLIQQSVRMSKRSAARRGAYSNPAKNRRGAITKRATSRITEEMVAYIRSAPGPARLVAQKMGISLSYCKAIRQGRSRKDYGNPFAGMMR